MISYSDLRQAIVESEISVLLRLGAPSFIYGLYGNYAIITLAPKMIARDPIGKRARRALTSLGRPAVRPLFHIIETAPLFYAAPALAILAKIDKRDFVNAGVTLENIFRLAELFRYAGADIHYQPPKDIRNAIRSCAATILGKLNASAAVPVLGAALNQASPQVREYALNSLEEIKSEAAVYHILRACADENEDVASTARRAFGQALDDVSCGVRDADQLPSAIQRAAAEISGSLGREKFLELKETVLQFDYAGTIKRLGRLKRQINMPGEILTDRPKAPSRGRKEMFRTAKRQFA